MSAACWTVTVTYVFLTAYFTNLLTTPCSSQSTSRPRNGEQIIELGIFVDAETQRLFGKYRMETRRAIDEIVFRASSLFMPLNVSIVVTYYEEWSDNKIKLDALCANAACEEDKYADVFHEFASYIRSHPKHGSFDHAHLFSSALLFPFTKPNGLAALGEICTGHHSTSISLTRYGLTNGNTSASWQLAPGVTMAHEIAHSIGIDDDDEACCRSFKCVMSTRSSPLTLAVPRWSVCSRRTLAQKVTANDTWCLRNKPQVGQSENRPLESESAADTRANKQAQTSLNQSRSGNSSGSTVVGISSVSTTLLPKPKQTTSSLVPSFYLPEATSHASPAPRLASVTLPPQSFTRAATTTTTTDYTSKPIELAESATPNLIGRSKSSGTFVAPSDENNRNRVYEATTLKKAQAQSSLARLITLKPSEQSIISSYPMPSPSSPPSTPISSAPAVASSNTQATRATVATVSVSESGTSAGAGPITFPASPSLAVFVTKTSTTLTPKQTPGASTYAAHRNTSKSTSQLRHATRRRQSDVLSPVVSIRQTSQAKAKVYVTKNSLSTSMITVSETGVKTSTFESGAAVQHKDASLNGSQTGGMLQDETVGEERETTNSTVAPLTAVTSSTSQESVLRTHTATVQVQRVRVYEANSTIAARARGKDSTSFSTTEHINTTSGMFTSAESVSDVLVVNQKTTRKPSASKIYEWPVSMSTSVMDDGQRYSARQRNRASGAKVLTQTTQTMNGNGKGNGTESPQVANTTKVLKPIDMSINAQEDSHIWPFVLFTALLFLIIGASIILLCRYYNFRLGNARSDQCIVNQYTGAGFQFYYEHIF